MKTCFLFVLLVNFFLTSILTNTHTHTHTYIYFLNLVYFKTGTKKKIYFLNIRSNTIHAMHLIIIQTCNN
jgi:hypothetical protein